MDALVVAGQLGRLLADVIVALFVDRPRREVIVTQFYHIGYLSLPVVLITGISIGMVMAVQAYGTLIKFNAEVMTGPMVNFTMITQLGPALTALMVAGRVGSNMAAEIGTMRVTEQIDALRVMGTDPTSYLVAPRFLACVLLLPVLSAIAAAAGIIAGATLVVGIWQVDAGAYWFRSSQFLLIWDIVTGLSKTVVFGAIISLVSCRQGLRTTGGATGVGTACTLGVVQASLLILVANFLMTVVYNKLWYLMNPAWKAM
jgi:phospholipid/cholesterol/gamma-HCH transport system permease protein